MLLNWFKQSNKDKYDNKIISVKQNSQLQLPFFKTEYEQEFLPVLRRFNPTEPVVKKICNLLED